MYSNPFCLMETIGDPLNLYILIDSPGVNNRNSGHQPLVAGASPIEGLTSTSAIEYGCPVYFSDLL